MKLDPQIALVIEGFDAGFPPVHTMTGAQARAVIRARFVPAAKPEPVAEVRDHLIPGPGGDIPVRIYRPDRDADTSRFWCTGMAAVSCSAIWIATMDCAATSPITFLR